MKTCNRPQERKKNNYPTIWTRGNRCLPVHKKPISGNWPCSKVITIRLSESLLNTFSKIKTFPTKVPILFWSWVWHPLYKKCHCESKRNQTVGSWKLSETFSISERQSTSRSLISHLTLSEKTNNLSKSICKRDRQFTPTKNKSTLRIFKSLLTSKFFVYFRFI